jgi:hypothetical protein
MHALQSTTTTAIHLIQIPYDSLQSPMTQMHVVQYTTATHIKMTLPQLKNFGIRKSCRTIHYNLNYNYLHNPTPYCSLKTA